MDAPIVIGSDSYVIVRVPEGASAGELVVEAGNQSSRAWTCDIGVQIADNLYPVGNPAVDAFGNIFVTFSGSRGQKTPVSVYKIDLNYTPKPFVSDLMNATGLAFDKDGILYVSSRYDGVVYQVTSTGSVSVYVEGMGVATGIAFDHGRESLRRRSRRHHFQNQPLPPDLRVRHARIVHRRLSPGFRNDDYLYVTGPTTSSFDSVYRISPAGEVETYYRGLGRPQGLAFDAEGRLYVAGSLGGRRGVVRFDQKRNPELFLSGPGIVGLAFTPSRALLVTTNSALFRADVGISGRPLP